MKRFLTILLVLIPLFAAAELVQPVTWSGEEVGDSVRLKAAIEEGWHMTIIEFGEREFDQEFTDEFTLTVAKTDLSPIRFNACDDKMCTAPEIWEWEEASPKSSPKGKDLQTSLPFREGQGVGYSLSCSITNTGKYDAYEVAQLYTHQKSGYMVRPLKELKGFEKVYIPAGESRTVTFTLTDEQLGYWHESHHDFASKVWFETDSADYEVWIAPDSRCQTTPVQLTL